MKRSNTISRRTFIKRSAAGMGLVSLLGSSSFSLTDRWQNSLAPGKWKFEPSALVSGTETKLSLKYENGSKVLPPGAYHRIYLEPLSVKTLFHCPMSTYIKIVQKGQDHSKIDIEKGDIHGWGYWDLKIKFPEGLRPFDSFELVIGNKKSDGTISAVINPVPVENITCQIFSDLYGDGNEVDWFEKGWSYALPKANIYPAKAEKIKLVVPSVIEKEKKFDLKLAITDRYDSAGFPPFEGVILFEKQDIQDLPEKIVFSKKDKCAKKVKSLSVNKEGIYRIKAKFYGSDEVFESNPVAVKKKVERTIYWGDIA